MTKSSVLTQVIKWQTNNTTVKKFIMDVFVKFHFKITTCNVCSLGIAACEILRPGRVPISEQERHIHDSIDQTVFEVSILP